MELIDKDKVVKEIERRIANHNKELERASDEDFVSSWASDEENQKFALTALIPFLNTLEVKEVDLQKEVDLEKEIDDYWRSLFCDYKMKRVAGHKFVPAPEYIDENFNQCENGKTQIAYVLELDWKTDFNDVEWNGDDVIKFARYFYELGLKAKKGE